MTVVDRGHCRPDPHPVPLVVIPVARQHGSHSFRPATNRGNTGARHFDEAKRTHQVDKLIDLVGVACDLEHKALGGGVDHAGAKRVRQPQRLDAMLALSANLDHCKLALDRAFRQRHVDDAIHRDHAVELMLDLLDHHRRARRDDGDAREMLLALGLRDREALDVVAAPREQADDAREHAGLVLHEHRKRVRLVRVVAFLDEIGGCGLVHCRPLHSRRYAVARRATGASVPTQPRNRSKSILPPDSTRPTRFPDRLAFSRSAAASAAAPAPSARLCVSVQSAWIASAISSSVTWTIREAPLRMTASAPGSGIRVAMPSASVLLVSVVTTWAAANDSA